MVERAQESRINYFRATLGLQWFQTWEPWRRRAQCRLEEQGGFGGAGGPEGGFRGPRGIAEGKREKVWVKEQYCKQRPQTGILRAGFFCGLILFGPHSVFLKLELNVFIWRMHSSLYCSSHCSPFSFPTYLNTFMEPWKPRRINAKETRIKKQVHYPS